MILLINYIISWNLAKLNNSIINFLLLLINLLFDNKINLIV